MVLTIYDNWYKVNLIKHVWIYDWSKSPAGHYMKTQQYQRNYYLDEIHIRWREFNKKIWNLASKNWRVPLIFASTFSFPSKNKNLICKMKWFCKAILRTPWPKKKSRNPLKLEGDATAISASGRKAHGVAFSQESI